MKQIFKLCSVLLCVTIQAHAQSIERQVIASSGNSLANSSGSIEFTIAETVTQNMSSANYNLSNGFHQPSIVVTAVNQMNSLDGIRIFPNPSSQWLVVQFNKLPSSTLLELFDVDGKLLQSSYANELQTTLSLKDLANGAYYLKINSSRVYKIIKLN